MLLERELFEPLRDVTGDHGRAQPAAERRRCARCPATTSAAARTWTRPAELDALRAGGPVDRRAGAVKLEQSFEVRAPLERVWETLIDVERVAPCLPGAEITEAGDDGTYRGTFSVRLGPTTAAYRGELEMEELDEAAHRVVTMRASGQDKRGQGSAKATIVSTMRAEGDVTHGRRGDRLHDHRPAGALRPRRDDPGHLEPAAEGLRRLPPAEDRGAAGGRAERGRRGAGGDAGGRAAAPPAAGGRSPTTAKPIGGFSLFFRALLDRLRRLFSRG